LQEVHFSLQNSPKNAILAFKTLQKEATCLKTFKKIQFINVSNTPKVNKSRNNKSRPFFLKTHYPLIKLLKNKEKISQTLTHESPLQNVLESKQQQYNAAMAQFLELCGSVGLGCRLAKTVVVGADSELINQVLFILSYFIRCSNVETRPLGSEFLGILN
jgi:hypothetical protein